MENMWLFLPAAAALVAISWYVMRRPPRHGEKQALKEQVQTWEDEGGNVPEVPTVSPRSGEGRTGSTGHGA